MAKKPLPFPLEVFDVPEVRRLRAIAYGIFARLAFDYWLTGIPLPKNDYELVVLANSDLTTMKRHMPSVGNCLGIIMPELERRRTKYSHRLEVFRKNASHARLHLKPKGKNRQEFLSDENDTHTQFSAIPPAFIANNAMMTDPHARTASIAKTKAQTSAPVKLLTDK